ncbi:MAG: ABC transporter ATP-binding protein [Clostridiales bacterium]
MNKKIFQKHNNKIEFKNINFSYNKENVLNNINLRLEQGKINTITGKNGSGKTTLINLILGIWDNYCGDILINDINIKEIKRSILLENIAFCFQSTPVFRDSVKKNIILDEELDDCYLNELLKEMGFYEDIQEMEKGIDTIIGGRDNISGGQNQKLGLIRTLYTKKSILVFDEPTSSLDKKSQKMFLDKVKSIKENHLVVIISHSLNIIQSSDFLFEIN